MSVPKNANVSRPRDRTTAGSPGRARNVPGGVRRRNGPSPTSRPATIPGTSSQRGAAKLATTSAAPAATRAASTRRWRRNRTTGAVPSRSNGPIRIIAGTTIVPAIATSGSKPRNTQRHPSVSDTRSARTGPISPGTTHAVERIANIRGRSASVKALPIAT